MGKAFLIKKQDGSYLPAYEEDRKALEKVKVGNPIEVSWSKPRNYKNHKRFFAMLACTIDNMPDAMPDRYRNQEYLRYELMIAVGHCEIRESLSGKQYFKPKSMSFKSMDEEEFQKLYSLCADYLIKYFLYGLSLEEFEANLKLYM